MKQEFELAFWLSKMAAKVKSPVPIYPYLPATRPVPSRTLDASSSWKGLENILGDIITHFDLPTHRCLEFGVEYGFSTVALSSYFDSVTGVDTFQGDRHTNNIKDIYTETVKNLAPYPNIQVVRSDYQTFTKGNDQQYDMIHVDIIHTFADTYACGLWSAQHSRCTIFHDTESFPQVKQAVLEIARTTGKKFYNFTEFYGLGIIV